MSASSPLRSSASIEVDLSVTPFRRWKKSHFSMQSSKVNRRYSSGPIPTFSNKSLGDFVRPRKLDMVLKVYPADMPLLTFCHIDPNTITIEDEALREKVIVALHAARACCVMNFEVSFIKKPLEVACLTSTECFLSDLYTDTTTTSEVSKTVYLLLRIESWFPSKLMTKSWYLIGCFPKWFMKNRWTLILPKKIAVGLWSAAAWRLSLFSLQ